MWKPTKSLTHDISTHDLRNKKERERVLKLESNVWCRKTSVPLLYTTCGLSKVCGFHSASLLAFICNENRTFHIIDFLRVGEIMR
jgi:hypothetical protein